MQRTAFAIKAEVSDPQAKTFAFKAQKTMYGGKHIAKGDTVFIFASENEGGQGLISRGVVTSAEAVAKKPGIARQTPRASIRVQRTALVKRCLGRSELKPVRLSPNDQRQLVAFLHTLSGPLVAPATYLEIPAQRR